MDNQAPETPRQSMDVDIVCVGFGPATAAFLTHLSRALVDENGQPLAESKAMPGMPPQVICYERADDISFGVSGIVTKGRAIKASFPDLDVSQIPMAAPVSEEKVVYLMDPVGASRKGPGMKAFEKMLGLTAKKDAQAMELPFIPDFMAKHDGFVMSMGQFQQWVGSEVMGSGLVQVWPGSPVAEPLVESRSVKGVRLADQGVDKQGNPEAAYMPGMDIKAQLTVLGDGPYGPVSRQLDRKIGVPEGHHVRDWAVGMKMVVELPENSGLKPGTVLHTIGYPEPEIFGFLYVYPDNIASLGIFVPSWFDSPVRTAYRYLQHWMMHPYLWRHLEGGTMRSWGAKSLQESGKRGEPILAGDGFARIGEGSGSTNVLSNSGVDEAWATGAMLAEAVIELMREGKEFTKENLEQTYVKRRRESWVEEETKIASKARDGFQKGVLPGLIGTGIAGFSKGKLSWPARIKRPYERIPTLEKYYEGKVSAEEIEQLRQETQAKGLPLHNALMTRAGWPEIPYDGQLLVSHQDALLMGGKVQAAPGYADHVRFVRPETCEKCRERVCIEACSGQAIMSNPDGGVPVFDREKCIHCGACIWNCSKAHPTDPERTNVEFKAGSGGLHSVEN